MSNILIGNENGIADGISQVYIGDANGKAVSIGEGKKIAMPSDWRYWQNDYHNICSMFCDIIHDYKGSGYITIINKTPYYMESGGGVVSGPEGVITSSAAFLYYGDEQKLTAASDGGDDYGRFPRDFLLPTTCIIPKEGIDTNGVMTNVEAIHEKFFMNWQTLTIVAIPKTIKYLPSFENFYESSSGTTIYYEGTEEEWAQINNNSGITPDYYNAIEFWSNSKYQ